MTNGDFVKRAYILPASYVVVMALSFWLEMLISDTNAYGIGFAFMCWISIVYGFITIYAFDLDGKIKNSRLLCDMRAWWNTNRK